MTTLKKTFWDRIEDVQAGMLKAEGARPVPMSPMVDDDAGAIWFITAAGTEVGRAAAQGTPAQFMAACGKARLYAVIDGSLSVCDDADVLDDLWNPVVDAWFDGGKDDPDARLIRFVPARAEVWATDGALAFAWEIAKANVTDEKPDMGEHGTIIF